MKQKQNTKKNQTQTSQYDILSNLYKRLVEWFFLLLSPLDQLLVTDLNMNSEQRTAEGYLSFLSLHPMLCLSCKFRREAPIKKERMQ